MTKQLAIMKGVNVGMRDAPAPCMWFVTYVSEGEAALQVLSWNEARDLIKDSKVHNISDLEDKACWVEYEEYSTIKFLGVADI